MGRVNWGTRPADQGPSGSSAPGKLRKRSASGHAAAKARRTRLAVSTTRAAIFKRRRRSGGTPAGGQFPGFGNGVANGKHQPISSGVENEADLVGERRTAARAIGGELCLMQLDQILGLAARAIQAVVDPLGRADIEAGDDEADVEAERGRLNTGDGAPFAIPGLCLVARLGIAAQSRQGLEGR